MSKKQIEICVAGRFGYRAELCGSKPMCKYHKKALKS